MIFSLLSVAALCHCDLPSLPLNVVFQQVKSQAKLESFVHSPPGVDVV